MRTHSFHTYRLLRSLYGTEPFGAYCRMRDIPFRQTLTAILEPADKERWRKALTELPPLQQAKVELELAEVQDMSSRQALAHLLHAAEGLELPPDPIPSGPAMALWFLQHHPDLFHQVYLHHELAEVASWRIAHAQTGLVLADVEEMKTALVTTLRAFFQMHEGTGRFCCVEAHRLTDAYCFIAHLADRLRLLDIFTEDGHMAGRSLRPALPILFVYYPGDGAVLLKSHLRSRDRIAALFQCFGQTVLCSPISCHEHTFDLERFKHPFHPLPDAEDMELIRVQTLHLRHPMRAGQRLLKLETRTSDKPDAIDQLLRLHVADPGVADMRVCYAEVQVRLRVGQGHKNYRIRLWPQRCNLPQTPLGNRFHTCLQRWGLTHARQP